MSDFGTADAYAAQMKSELIRVCGADARLLDITHDIAPGDISAGAFILWSTVPGLARPCGVVAVVDPGVGTSRRALVVSCNGVLVACPDNGLAGWLDCEAAWELPQPGPGSSTTFHGRDVFAPGLGRIMAGVLDPADLEPVDPATIRVLDRRMPAAVPGGFEVSVAHVDGFGNCLLWLTPDGIDLGCAGAVRTAGRPVRVTPAATYMAGPAGLLAIPGSQGLVELALPGGSAASMLGLAAGDTLVIEMEAR
jgi:S-adenosyl-L-methionine hydrolase (adenosine-forming)